MDWFSALNFLVRGMPEEALTLSDHFIRISSRHGVCLESIGFRRDLLSVEGIGVLYEIVER